MPKGTAIGREYPTYAGKNAGTNLHRKNPPIGDSLGNGMHNPPRKTGGRSNETALGVKQSHTGPPEPRPRKRNRGAKPPTKAIAGTPQMGKTGGSIAGQTMGKIV